MLPKRTERSGDSGVFERDGADDTAVVAEALRVGTEATKAKSPEEGMSLFWRVFGGTLLSIVALVVITLFNNMMSTISELRGDISKLNEYRAELLKKDEFNTRMNTTWERIQTIQSQENAQNAALTSHRTELDGMKERLTRHAADVDAVRKDTVTVLDGVKKDTAAAVDAVKKESAAAVEAVKKDLAAIELLKERLTAVEAIRKDLAAFEGLKERVNALAAEAKNQREDCQKVRQDVEKNQAADIERKVRADERHREMEKALKELQTVLQDCQVKLARLEGPAPPKAVPVSAPVPKTPGGRPAEPGKAGPAKSPDEGD